MAGSSSTRDLQFMIFDNPNDVQKYRKQIRSHVTRHQHEQARRRRAKDGLQEGENVQELPDQQKRIAPSRARSKESSRTRAGRGKERTSGSTSREVSRRPSVLAGQLEESTDEAAVLYKVDDEVERRTRSHGRGIPIAWLLNAIQDDETASPGRIEKVMEGEHLETDQPQQMIASNMLKTALSRSFSPSVMAFQTFLLNDPNNTVGIALHHLGLELSSTLGAYEFIVKVQSQDFDPDIPPPPGVQMKRPNHISYLEFIFSDPMLVTAAILLTASFLVTARPSNIDIRKAYSHLLHLRGFLIQSINTALEDPVRGMSDQMLIAIALSSAYEIKYDPSMQGYRTHMAGLVKLINIRGGLAKIGEEHPGAERVLMWHAANTAVLADCNEFFDEMRRTSSLTTMPKPDAKMFRMQHVEVG